jgi:hypothetical protein
VDMGRTRFCVVQGHKQATMPNQLLQNRERDLPLKCQGRHQRYT